MSTTCLEDQAQAVRPRRVLSITAHNTGFMCRSPSLEVEEDLASDPLTTS